MAQEGRGEDKDPVGCHVSDRAKSWSFSHWMKSGRPGVGLSSAGGLWCGDGGVEGGII